MARFTLKTYCGAKLVETFEHRAVGKLQSILTHPRMNRAGETDPWGNPLGHANKFEIYDSMREKLFEGSVDDALSFIKTLK
jgi:hypothetical protein